MKAAFFSFLVTCLPFLKHAYRYDREVAAVALPLLLVRAAALGLGYINGMLRFRFRKGAENK